MELSPIPVWFYVGVGYIEVLAWQVTYSRRGCLVRLAIFDGGIWLAQFHIIWYRNTIDDVDRPIARYGRMLTIWSLGSVSERVYVYARSRTHHKWAVQVYCEPTRINHDTYCPGLPCISNKLYTYYWYFSYNLPCTHCYGCLRHRYLEFRYTSPIRTPLAVTLLPSPCVVTT